MVEASLERDSLIGLLLTKESEGDGYDPENLFSVGTVAKIVKKINLPDGGLNIFISTLKRFEVKRFVTDDKPLTPSSIISRASSRTRKRSKL